jgi:hypothetical protein
MDGVASTVAVTINTRRDDAFHAIAPIDLTLIFEGYGPLPAVIEVEDQSGQWDTVGQTRTTRLSDRSTALETLTAYDRPQYFAYSLENFSGPLRFLTSGARGEWWFEEMTPTATLVRWRYTFEPRSWLTFPLLSIVVRGLWHRYMREALQKAKEQAEGIVTVKNKTMRSA